MRGYEDIEIDEQDRNRRAQRDNYGRRHQSPHPGESWGDFRRYKRNERRFHIYDHIYDHTHGSFTRFLDGVIKVLVVLLITIVLMDWVVIPLFEGMW